MFVQITKKKNNNSNNSNKKKQKKTLLPTISHNFFYCRKRCPILFGLLRVLINALKIVVVCVSFQFIKIIKFLPSSTHFKPLSTVGTCDSSSPATENQFLCQCPDGSQSVYCVEKEESGWKNYYIVFIVLGVVVIGGVVIFGVWKWKKNHETYGTVV